MKKKGISSQTLPSSKSFRDSNIKKDTPTMKTTTTTTTTTTTPKPKNHVTPLSTGKRISEKKTSSSHPSSEGTGKTRREETKRDSKNDTSRSRSQPPPKKRVSEKLTKLTSSKKNNQNTRNSKIGIPSTTKARVVS